MKYINEVFPSFAVQTGLENNTPTYDYSRGYYRNILVHIELLRDAVSNSKTVEDVYKNIFKNMNHDYGDFWDLSVVQDPIEQGKITVMDKNVTHLKIKQSQDSDYIIVIYIPHQIDYRQMIHQNLVRFIFSIYGKIIV